MAELLSRKEHLHGVAGSMAGRLYYGLGNISWSAWIPFLQAI